MKKFVMAAGMAAILAGCAVNSGPRISLPNETTKDVILLTIIEPPAGTVCRTETPAGTLVQDEFPSLLEVPRKYVTPSSAVKCVGGNGERKSFPIGKLVPSDSVGMVGLTVAWASGKGHSTYSNEANELLQVQF